MMTGRLLRLELEEQRGHEDGRVRWRKMIGCPLPPPVWNKKKKQILKFN